MPCDYSKYPVNWFTEIRPAVIARAGDCCEECKVPNHSIIYSKRGKNGEWKFAPEGHQADAEALDGIKFTKVILTVAHLDHDSDNENVSLDRLRAWCQYHHLNYDRKRHIQKRKANKFKNQPEIPFMEDSFLNQEIRALSWKQPFATAMLHGKIETRTWDTKYRGLVLICASKSPYNKNQILSITGNYQFTHLNNVCNGSPFWGGHAIAIGRLVNSRPMQPGWDEEDNCFVQYQEGLFCHVYEDVKAIKPFLWKGTQGWKTLDEETKKKIILL